MPRSRLPHPDERAGERRLARSRSGRSRRAPGRRSGGIERRAGRCAPFRAAPTVRAATVSSLHGRGRARRVVRLAAARERVWRRRQLWRRRHEPSPVGDRQLDRRERPRREDRRRDDDAGRRLAAGSPAGADGEHAGLQRHPRRPSKAAEDAARRRSPAAGAEAVVARYAAFQRAAIAGPMPSARTTSALRRDALGAWPMRALPARPARLAGPRLWISESKVKPERAGARRRARPGRQGSGRPSRSRRRRRPRASKNAGRPGPAAERRGHCRGRAAAAGRRCSPAAVSGTLEPARKTRGPQVGVERGADPDHGAAAHRSTKPWKA